MSVFLYKCKLKSFSLVTLRSIAQNFLSYMPLVIFHEGFHVTPLCLEKSLDFKKGNSNVPTLSPDYITKMGNWDNTSSSWTKIQSRGNFIPKRDHFRFSLKKIEGNQRGSSWIMNSYIIFMFLIPWCLKRTFALLANLCLALERSVLR